MRIPWPLRFQDVRWLNRLVVFIFLIFWLLVFAGWADFELHRTLQNCEPPEKDSQEDIRIDEVGFTRRTLHEHYQIHEFFADPEAVKDDDVTPIVFVIDGADAKTSFQSMARQIRKKVGTPIPFFRSRPKFRFFALDFDKTLPIRSGNDTWSEYDFFVTAFSFLPHVSDRRPIFIVLNFGTAVVRAVSPMLAYLRENAHVTVQQPGLLILATAFRPVKHFVLDENLEHFHTKPARLWESALRHWHRMGIVAFGSRESNYPHDWWRNPSWRVPLSSLDGVVDYALTSRELLECRGFLEHVAELVVDFGARSTKWKTGREVVREFYAKLAADKKQALPTDWNKPEIEGAKELRTGHTLNFTMHQRYQWIDVKLRRNEWIYIYVQSTCVKSATVVRRERDICRKELGFHHVNQTDIWISDAVPFESIRVLLDTGYTYLSPSPCDVVVRTSHEWYVFAHRFYDGMFVDTLRCVFGALIALIWLHVIEGERRKRRYALQLQLTVLLFSLALYHSLSQFGTPWAGLITGASLITITALVSNGIRAAFMRLTKLNIVAFRLFYMFNTYFVACLSFFALFAFWSPSFSVHSLVELACFLNLPLLVPTRLAVTPLLMRFYRTNEEEPAANTATALKLIALSVGEAALVATGYRPKREHLKLIAFSLTAYFLNDLRMSPENELLALLFFLLFSRHAERHEPDELRELWIDAAQLEHEYLEQEGRERHQKQD